jgi:hypothetical protein
MFEWMKDHAFVAPWIQLAATVIALTISVNAIVVPQLLTRFRERRNERRDLDIVRMLAYTASSNASTAASVLFEPPSDHFPIEWCEATLATTAVRLEGALKLCGSDEGAFVRMRDFTDVFQWFHSQWLLARAEHDIAGEGDETRKRLIANQAERVETHFAILREALNKARVKQ